MPFTPAPTSPKPPGSKPNRISRLHGRGAPLVKAPKAPLALVPQGITRPTASQISRSAPPVPPKILINSGAAYRHLSPLYGATRVVGRPDLIREKSGHWIVLYILGRGPWENIDTLYINNDDGTDVSSNSGGAAFTNSSLFGSTGSARIFEGTSGQDVGGDFLTAFVPSFQDARNDPGMACIAMELRPAVQREPPRIECDCRGYNDIFDPRTSTSGYTANAALILADYITNADWGHNAMIDWDSVATCADNADEALGDGVRYECNLLLDKVQSTRDWIRHLQVYAGCFVQELGGTYYLIPDRPAAKVFDIGPSNVLIHKSGRLKKGLSRNRRPSDVVARWYDVTNNVVKDAHAVGGTTGQVSRIDVPGVTNYKQALRFAITQYKHLTLEDLSYSCLVRDEGMQFEIGDVHAITDTENGLSDKYMRLMRKRMADLGRWALSYQEYQETAYSNDITDDAVTVDTTLPDPNSPPTITGLTLTPQNKISASGVDAQIKFTWTDPAWLFVDYFIVELYIGSTLEGTTTISKGDTEGVFGGLIGTTSYQVRIRIKSFSGAEGTNATANATTLHNSIISKWNMEEAAAPLADGIGSFDITTLQGDFTFQITGKVGSYGVELDQTTNETFMEVTDNGLANTPAPWTFVGWAKLTAAASAGNKTFIINRYPDDTTNDVFSLEALDTRAVQVRLREIDDSETTWSTGKTMTLNTWHFFALSYNGARAALKVDTDNVVYQAVNLKDSLTSSKLHWGGGGASTDDGIIQVDEWRVYRVALTPEEMADIQSAEA